MLVGLIFQQISRWRHSCGQRLWPLPVGRPSTFQILGGAVGDQASKGKSVENPFSSWQSKDNSSQIVLGFTFSVCFSWWLLLSLSSASLVDPASLSQDILIKTSDRRKILMIAAAFSSKFHLRIWVFSFLRTWCGHLKSRPGLSPCTATVLMVKHRR